MRSAIQGWILRLVCVIAQLGSGTSSATEAVVQSDWSRVQKLRRGQAVWVATLHAALTEYVIADVASDEIRMALVSGAKISDTSNETVTEFCATSPEGPLATDGRIFDFSQLCRVVARPDVLEVHVRKRSSPLRAVLMGALIGGGAMLIPCQVAPQGDGSVAGCAVGSAGVGALVGWGVHGTREGHLVKIYTREASGPMTSKNARGSPVVRWPVSSGGGSSKRP